MHRLALLLITLVLQLPAVANEAPANVHGALTVNVLQAKHLYDHGALFIDVRPSREWAWGHVHGALHMDLLSRFAGLAQPRWPRDIPLVIYCDSEVCPRSALAVRQALDWGFTQVFYFRSGYFAWQLFDFPTGKGAAGEVLAFSPAVP